jgi:hypothetical protein
MLIRINQARHRLAWFVAVLLAGTWLLPTSCALAQAPAPAAASSPAAPPKPITTADIKNIKGPSAADQAKGDPAGTITGTVNDIPVSDTKAGLTLADVVDTVGQNRIAINLVWTLITGYLVMFMQAGFAAVETGLCRAKNANHTFMMNFMVYGWGLFAYWVMGFALQQGGCAPNTNLGGLSPLNAEFTINFLGGKPWGLFGQRGFFLSGSAYDVGVMVCSCSRWSSWILPLLSSPVRQPNVGNSWPSPSRPSSLPLSPIHSMAIGRGAAAELRNSASITDLATATVISRVPEWCMQLGA